MTRLWVFVPLVAACSEWGINAELPVAPGVPPDIEVVPSALQFGTLTAGEEERQSFNIRNLGQNALIVDDIDVAAGFAFALADDPGEIRIDRGDTVTVEVVFTPRGQDENFGQIIVHSNDIETPEVPVDTQAVTSAGSEADAGAPPSANGADPDTAADLAFVDPAMSYTVLAITYSGTEANRALAWQTYDLLQAEGFPVVKPLERNARIFLFVGAAGAIADLGEVRDRLQKLRVGPRETPDFREAYVVNLDLYR